jgi:hypothetical protein
VLRSVLRAALRALPTHFLRAACYEARQHPLDQRMQSDATASSMLLMMMLLLLLMMMMLKLMRARPAESQV